MSRIFISYRRQESSKDARALFEHLAARFGRTAVFMDVEGIALGVDFQEVLDQTLDGCAVMLALMGPGWADARDDAGERRLEDPNGFVRIEIRTALKRRIPLVPVFVDGAQMPRSQRLPEDIASLARRNGMPLDHQNWDAQTARLIRALEQWVGTAGHSVDAPPTQVVARPDAGREEIAVPQPAPASGEPPATPWANRSGQDGYGYWAEFEVKGVVQRLRWLPPGEFLMGSPAEEPERASDDSEWSERQHPVTLSRGYWLADTACSQALWQAVLGGETPSHFEGAERPVERVSWEAITQRFLPALNQLVPGLAAVLPTEAQWEYACRAGTTTPFSFGPNIRPEQVNYDGNHPYHQGKKGQHRGETVAVQALPANGWGLYQMHGNVWEWCADWLGPYPVGPALDPTGPAEGRGRVLRGGSWGSSGRSCRSAYHNGSVPGDRNGNFGFRLARGTSLPAGSAHGAGR